MVAIEHRQKSTTNTNINVTNNNNDVILTSTTVTSPTTPTSPILSSATSITSTNTSISTASIEKTNKLTKMSGKLMSGGGGGGGVDGNDTKTDINNSKITINQRNATNKINVTDKEITKKMLKLDLTSKDLEEFSLKSPKSPVSARLPHQSSLTSSVDVEDRKTLREALYQGIFSRHRRTIFAFGSFLRMLRSRSSQYNTIRSSSEGEEVEEVR